MPRLILDYAHGWESGGAEGPAVRRVWTDGVPLHEEDALLILGTPLERRLESELGLTPGSELVLTRPDANNVSDVQRARVANQYVGRPDAYLVSVHAHRRPWEKGGRVKVYRPRRGPAPADTDARSPDESKVVEFWREIAELEDYATMVAARSVRLARDIGRGRKSEPPGTVERAIGWLTGQHVAAAAERVFRLSLIPAAVVEIALGETDADVEKSLTKQKAELVEELFRGIEAVVGWTVKEAP